MSNLDPLQMLLDAAEFIKRDKPEWAKAARAAVAASRVPAPERQTSPPDTAKIAVSRETIGIALSAIRASQERDYYHNFARAQRELEALS